MKLGYNLTIEQTQKLTMTPELIQAIQILQFNTQELESYVSEQLLTNPVLEPDHSRETNETEEIKPKEENKEDALSDYIKEREFDDISYKQRDYSKREKENTFEKYVSAEITLPEHLMFQLQFASKKTKCRQIGRYIIESLDENGYMTSTEEEIAEALHTCIENVDKVLKLIQTFDPVGVAACDLGHCLLAQLDNQGKKTVEFEKVLTEHLEDLAANRLNVIARDLKMPVVDVQKMADEIKTLDPRPGRQFASMQDETRYIIPDVHVEKINGDYVITMNETNVPGLMVSSYYRKVLAESKNDDKLSSYLSERLNSAMWLIKSIEQRKQTILNVVTTIVEYQKDFFDKGEKHLKTLTLKQVADEIGIHESTVSRSINGKYMQSPRGVFELKYFFTAGVQKEGGDSISSTGIKKYIRELIDAEDQKSPHSDQMIVRMLEQRGIKISRRTVAKYRDEMNILSSSKRKRY
ncbi:MAG: RNA polymerase factor sigma-54 [Eubacteriaceae bacterium]|nr:RNA polymerase factor sigma-54 [Eubacteriaceae bacterium]